MPFVLDLGADAGGLLSVDDLTLDEIISAEQGTGASWIELNPLAHAGHCRALLVEAYVHRGMPRDQAVVKVGGMSIKAAAAAVDYVPEDDRPVEHRDGLPVVDPKDDGAVPATT